MRRYIPVMGIILLCSCSSGYGNEARYYSRIAQSLQRLYQRYEMDINTVYDNHCMIQDCINAYDNVQRNPNDWSRSDIHHLHYVCNPGTVQNALRNNVYIMKQHSAATSPIFQRTLNEIQHSSTPDQELAQRYAPALKTSIMSPCTYQSYFTALSGVIGQFFTRESHNIRAIHNTIPFIDQQEVFNYINNCALRYHHLQEQPSQWRDTDKQQLDAECHPHKIRRLLHYVGACFYTSSVGTSQQFQQQSYELARSEEPDTYLSNNV